ncbi:MAG: SLOG family protein [Faecousia sp.]
MDLRAQTCCFPGHRKLPNEELCAIAERLEKEIVKSIKAGYKFFGAGGALGFDTMAAQKVIELKKCYPDIKLILVLPCLSQTRGWKHEDIEIYEDIKSKADKIVYTSKEYTPYCMLKRNRHLVDYSTKCICYLTENKGGTAYTIDYARKQNVSVINIALD